MTAAIAGLVGVLIGSAVTLLRDRVESTRRRDEWIRDQRVAASRRLLGSALAHGPICSRLKLRRGEPDAMRDYETTTLALYEAHADLAILGPTNVHEAGHALISRAFELGGAELKGSESEQKAAQARIGEAEVAYVRAVKESLGIEFKGPIRTVS